jgi:hypothetical protein
VYVRICKPPEVDLRDLQPKSICVRVHTSTSGISCTGGSKKGQQKEENGARGRRGRPVCTALFSCETAGRWEAKDKKGKKFKGWQTQPRGHGSPAQPRRRWPVRRSGLAVLRCAVLLQRLRHAMYNIHPWVPMQVNRNPWMGPWIVHTARPYGS